MGLWVKLCSQGILKTVLNLILKRMLESRSLAETQAPYHLVRTMRASFNVLGPLLARYGQAEVSLPGGCAIGPRPVDQHLAGLAALGASVTIESGYVRASAERGLIGTDFSFDCPSVGATEHLLMAAVLAKGQTRLSGCAREPEIVDLAAFLNQAGASIRGAGTSEIEINRNSRHRIRHADARAPPPWPPAHTCAEILS